MTQPPAGIRCAIADDLDGMLRADHVAAQGDPERAEFLRSSLMLGQCQVHVADGAVTGFVIVKPAHFFGRDFIEILIVDPALRRSGIGRALLRHALATAGTSRVFTSTNTSSWASPQPDKTCLFQVDVGQRGSGQSWTLTRCVTSMTA